MKNKSFLALIIFTLGYLSLGAVCFIKDFNLEFVIYVVVLLLIFGGVLAIQKKSQFPIWMLWVLSIWGLMHILGGAVETRDGVLFAYRIYTFLDFGGEFYILKYDQMVHGYLYGVVAVMAYHLLRHRLLVNGHNTLVFFFAVMASLGVSGLNEIMEFFISLTMENGVGGYDNTMLDMCFNLGGAIIATYIYTQFSKK
jgi:hypothetical protein